MAVSSYEIVGLEIQSLAGFRRAVFDLSGPRMFLLGPNNSGKTTALRLLDWSVNRADPELLNGDRRLRPDEMDLLQPARDTRGTGRRLILRVRVQDGREAAGFGAKRGVAELRIRVLKDRAYASHERPTKGEKHESSDKGIELYRRIAASNHLQLIDASRDADSTGFASTLADVVSERLMVMGAHRHRGGAPMEYRNTKASLGKIVEIAGPLLADLDTDLQTEAVRILLDDLHVELVVDQEEFVRSLAAIARIRITTGTHDANSVSPSRVGSGLQSLLQVSAVQSLDLSEGTNWLLMDEPESHLHPSTQRALSQLLSQPSTTKLVASTHSPFMIEEARYRDLFVVKNHVVHNPSTSDAVEQAKLENVIAAEGAEALFYSSILLLEGQGDVKFMNALKRRLSQVKGSSRVHEAFALAVGGSKSFGVWLKLLRGFRSPAGDLPWAFLAVCDGVDATTDIRRGLADAKMPATGSTDAALREVATAVAVSREKGIDATRLTNSSAVVGDDPIHLWEVDLEYAALRNAKRPTIRRIGEALGGPTDCEPLLNWLGSKYSDRPGETKAPWMRAEIARLLPWSEVSDEAKEVLTRWVTPVVGGRESAESLVESVRI